MGRWRDELLERAQGVPELRSRAEEMPIWLKAEGARLYDVDKIGYIDYVGAGGAAIVGYANQFIIDSVRKVLATGVPDGLHVPQEVDLAESLGRFLPWAGSWWFSRNQDDAVAAVLPWLRRTSGKPLILWLDGGARFGIGANGGAGDAGVEDTSIREVPGWDIERIEAAITAGASKVAGLVVDPLMTRAGVIPPPAGGLERLADACSRCGVLLVLDERVSGFRVDRGGAAAAIGVTPDVAIYGGALGGGFSIGAVAFREGLEATVSTCANGLRPPNVLSLAAAEAVLSVLKNDTVYERLESRTEQLVSGLLALAERFSRPMTINRMGSAFAIYTQADPVESLRGAERSDVAAYRRLVDSLRDEGVLLPRESGGTAFLSNAHGAKDVDETLAACERVLLRMHQEDLP